MEITEYKIGDKTIYKTDRGVFWRLIHDGIKVVDIFESDGITETPLNIFIAQTEEECLLKVQELGLSLPPSIEEEEIGVEY